MRADSCAPGESLRSVVCAEIAVSATRDAPRVREVAAHDTSRYSMPCFGKNVAQSTWEQSHAPAPRWGGGGSGGSSGGGGGGGDGASARALEAAEEMAGELRPAKKTKREAKSFGDFSGW